MPKILVIEPCLIAGQHHEAGAKLTIGEDDARTLSSCRRVQFIEDDAVVDSGSVNADSAESGDLNLPLDEAGKKSEAIPE